MSQPSIPDELKIDMYKRMGMCRQFEERVNSLFLQGRFPGTIHQSQGQEACAVGVCFALKKDDIITSTHRPHSHALARGVPVKHLMAELYAKKTGCCHGKGGSMHIGDPDAGMLTAIAIVGGGIPVAAGYALAFQYLKQDRVAVCFFGDGGVNEGIFHETLNMAAIWNLPAIFVCENNLYGASTAVDKVMKIRHISERAAAYGMPGETVDGNDVEETYSATLRAAARARDGKGPTLLELETYRFAGHSRSDPGHYRPISEVAAWKKRDPIIRFEHAALASGLLTAEQIAETKSETERILDEAVRFAEESPSPVPEDCLTDVFA